ncbi:MAG: type II secretion system F family protein, partial [Candidatus Eremiobacteraeota bacterium]|nr:type II secretion system F family protein [Candidatus Eremiobacteraeota bacterium]
ELLEKTCDDKLMAEVAAELGKRVSAGEPISKVLSLYPGAFGPFQVELVRVGEATGTLSAVVAQLAECEQARQRLVRRVRAALTYPSLVAFLALVGLLVAPPYLLEGVFTVIRQSGQEPPWLTKVVMGLSSALTTPWPWILLATGLAALFSTIPGLLRRPDVWQRLLAVPGLGSCLRCAGMARFASALALCQRAGLDLLAAIRLSAGASADPVLLAHEASIRASIQDGNGLRAALEQTRFFTPMFLELVGSGEEVARVELMLDWIARSCEQELEAALEVYAALLEPAMLLAVGAVVAVLVVATLAPMLTIIGSL